MNKTFVEGGGGEQRFLRVISQLFIESGSGLSTNILFLAIFLIEYIRIGIPYPLFIRRSSGGFPGADVILGQLKAGTTRKRVGFRSSGPPVRGNMDIVDQQG